MKSKLNLTIDEITLKSVKQFAKKKNVSISDLVEDYFKNLVKQKKRETFTDRVEKLGSHNIDSTVNLKDLYYQDKKRGF